MTDALSKVMETEGETFSSKVRCYCKSDDTSSWLYGCQTGDPRTLRSCRGNIFLRKSSGRTWGEAEIERWSWPMFTHPSLREREENVKKRATEVRNSLFRLYCVMLLIQSNLAHQPATCFMWSPRTSTTAIYASDTWSSSKSCWTQP